MSEPNAKNTAIDRFAREYCKKAMRELKVKTWGVCGIYFDKPGDVAKLALALRATQMALADKGSDMQEVASETPDNHITIEVTMQNASGLFAIMFLEEWCNIVKVTDSWFDKGTHKDCIDRRVASNLTCYWILTGKVPAGRR